MKLTRTLLEINELRIIPFLSYHALIHCVRSKYSCVRHTIVLVGWAEGSAEASWLCAPSKTSIYHCSVILSSLRATFIRQSHFLLQLHKCLFY